MEYEEMARPPIQNLYFPPFLSGKCFRCLTSARFFLQHTGAGEKVIKGAHDSQRSFSSSLMT